MSDGKKKKAPLPTKQQLLDFIHDSPTPVGKREIARAFRIAGADRIPLKAMLKELERDGRVDRGRGRRVARPGAPVFVAFLNRLQVLRVAVNQDMPIFTPYTFDLVKRWHEEGVTAALTLRAVYLSERLPTMWPHFAADYSADVQAAA